jgi:anti-sigma B factor antagonist
MDIFEGRNGGKITLSIDGRLDTMSVHALEAYFDKIKDIAEELVLDLSGMTCLSSAGLRVILLMLKWMNVRNRKLVITNISPAIQETFATTGMLDLFVRDERFVILETARNTSAAIYSLAGILDAPGIIKLSELFSKLSKDIGVREIILDGAKLTMVSNEARSALTAEKKRQADKGVTLRLVHFDKDEDKNEKKDGKN